MGRVPRTAWLSAAALVAVLVALGGQYGFHRDEYYFIEGGRHLDWAQPDNPFLVPLLAAGWHDLVGGHLWAFRLLPAVAAGVTVLLAALTSRQLGGTPRHAAVTAVLTAVTGVVVGTGHLFSITTFDLTLTSAALLLLIRALHQHPQRLGPWLVTGVVTGVALQVKVLSGLVLCCCLIGVLIAGPRRPLATPGPWLTAAVAGVLAAPNLVWQAMHSWPMLDVAAHIAAGGSTSSADRASVVPLHLALAGTSAVVLVVGVVALLRERRLRPYRWLAVAYLAMLILVVVTGGKPYYMAGFFPAVLAAGAMPVTDWADRNRARRVVAVGALVVLSIPTPFISLPLVPVGSVPYQIAVAVNPDTAETVGWRAFIDTVAKAAAEVPPEQRPHTIVLTRNYGEAGALSRERRLTAHASRGPWLPPTYSGHNAYGEWGPPPASARTVILVGGFTDRELRRWFDGRCDTVAQIASPPGVENEETGAPVRLCQRGERSWTSLWPEIKHLG